MATAENTAIVQFPEPTGTQQDPVAFGVFEGTTRLTLRPLTDDVDAPISGADVSFPAGGIVFTLLMGQGSEDFAMALFETYFDAVSLTVRLYSNLNGTSELSGNGYAAQTIAAGGMTIAAS